LSGPKSCSRRTDFLLALTNLEHPSRGTATRPSVYYSVFRDRLPGSAPREHVTYSARIPVSSASCGIRDGSATSALRGGALYFNDQRLSSSFFRHPLCGAFPVSTRGAKYVLVPIRCQAFFLRAAAERSGGRVASPLGARFRPTSAVGGALFSGGRARRQAEKQRREKSRFPRRRRRRFEVRRRARSAAGDTGR